MAFISGDVEATKHIIDVVVNVLDDGARRLSHNGQHGFRRIENPADGDCMLYALLQCKAGSSDSDCSQAVRDALRRQVCISCELIISTI